MNEIENGQLTIDEVRFSNSLNIWPHQLTLTWTQKQLKKETTQISETSLAILISILLIKTNTMAILALKIEK